MAAQSYWNNDPNASLNPPPPAQRGWDMQGSKPYAQQQQQQPDYNNYNHGNGGGAYPPPQGPPPGSDLEYGRIGDAKGKWGDTAPFSQQTEHTGARFRPKLRINDPIFLVLFIANFAGFVVVSAIAIKSFVENNGLGGGVGSSTNVSTGTSVTLDYHTVYLLLLVCGLALAIAAIWMMTVRVFTKIIIEVSLALTVLLNIGICIYYFIIKYWSGAIIFLVIAAISVFCYFGMRRRIPLAKLFLQMTIDITKHHPSVYVITFGGLIMQALVSVWYSFTVIAIYVKWTPNSAACVAGASCSSAKVAGLVFYATFSYYWITQVIANVVLCTLAGGVFGGWYYYGPRMSDGVGLPKNATFKALGRAVSTSLGSISFGSLIVTILEMLKMIAQSARNMQQQQGDMVGQIIACCAVCCISCLQWMVEYFNKYAYIEIALFGKAYIPAAKDTWRLLKDRGIDALINDSLIGMVIMWGSYINGFLCGLFAFMYLKFTEPSYNADGQYTAPVLLFSFLIGINLSYTVGSAIDAGVSTIFVGLGEDPMILQQRAPALFEEIRQRYPKVVQSVGSHQQQQQAY